MQIVELYGVRVQIAELLSDLPHWPQIKKLYLDFETTSEFDDRASTNPWHTCKILGIALLVDEEQLAWYIPVGHRSPSRFKNISLEKVQKWLVKDLFPVVEEWVNHNIKYDYHVLVNNTGYKPTCKLTDSLSRVKLLPMVEKFSYGLDICTRDFLYKDIKPFEDNIKRWLKQGRGKSKDYGIIPIEDMAPYAAVDTYSVKDLNKLCDREIPEDVEYIEDIEMQLIPIVLEMENEGMPLDLMALCVDAQVLPTYLENLAKEIGFEPHKSAECKYFFLEKHGLPIVGYTEEGNPSFGEEEILKYSKYLPEVCEKILRYKEKHKLLTGFTNPYVDHQINGRVHSDYNLIVRSGRMSCRTPNMQQLSPAAKMYIKPPEGWSILDVDFSQIEFRTIVHYINNPKCIADYNENPDTDFHDWVAAMCGILRKPAKNINFMLGYGGGKTKCVSMLQALPDIIAGLTEEEIGVRALSVYNTYHGTLPELKATAYKASESLRQRGYVRTFYGRRRYLPIKAHFKSFNSICQGTAADILKRATVRLYNEYLRGNDTIKLIAMVHDSWVFLTQIGTEQWHIENIKQIIEERPEYNGMTFRVPLRSKAVFSTVSWKECG